MPEPMSADERADLLHCADGWSGQPDAAVSRISVGDGYRRWEATVRAVEAELVAQAQAAERYRAALEFYADLNNWTQPTSDGGHIFHDEAPAVDFGRRAHDALSLGAS